MSERWIEDFKSGKLTEGWKYFGAHPDTSDGVDGWTFRVWAPHARQVSVVGDFNGWRTGVNPLTGSEGIWQGFIAGLKEYDVYKFAIETAGGKTLLKADPYAFHAETRPSNGSKLYDTDDYSWSDDKFVKSRSDSDPYSGPLNIYEVHIGSWKRRPDGGFYDYRTFGYELAEYVKEMGYNAVEILPVMEYPLDDSWGYQITGFFAPTSRYGTPADLKWMIDCLHAKGIKVILDWVPSHFCKDDFGLADFDGASCYEYEDPNKREHASWGTRVFDFGRPEVISFLYSSARYWLELFHADGLRVDAVASMLYLDYDRQGGSWTPNRYGGHENIEAIEFLRGLNRLAFSVNPNVLMIAEESTAWPMVTKPGYVGGLGFNFKWNMGWMNDMCHYLKLDPFFRKDNHKDITFSLMYAFSENFILPISHDEVVHMKGSLVNKMPGSYEQQIRSVRGFYSYMISHPGKKMLFMGAEIGQWHEWDFAGSLDWYLLDNDLNRRLQTFFADINKFYLKTRELWELDCDGRGFEWTVVDDTRNNVVGFIRRSRRGREMLCVVNFSPNPMDNYRMGVPPKKIYTPVFNSEDEKYGGTGYGDRAPVETEWVPSNGRESSIVIKIPALGGVFYKGTGRMGAKPGHKTAKK